MDTTPPLPRFATFEDLEWLANLGYPMENPEEYEILTAGVNSQHPNRIFVRKGYIFLFWLDEPQSYDEEKHMAKLHKRKMEQMRFQRATEMKADPRIQELVSRKK